MFRTTFFQNLSKGHGESKQKEQSKVFIQRGGESMVAQLFFSQKKI